MGRISTGSRSTGSLLTPAPAIVKYALRAQLLARKFGAKASERSTLSFRHLSFISQGSSARLESRGVDFSEPRGRISQISLITSLPAPLKRAPSRGIAALAYYTAREKGQKGGGSGWDGFAVRGGGKPESPTATAGKSQPKPAKPSQTELSTKPPATPLQVDLAFS